MPDTLQLVCPAGWQTVKVGDRLDGFAVRRTVALSFVPAVSQTQTAYWALVPARSCVPLSD